MAAAGLAVGSLTYEPCYRTEAGTGNAMGFATWGPAPGFARADPVVLARLSALDACAVSDALDALGLPGAVTGIGPMWTSGAVTAGRVRTVKAGPVGDAGPSTHIASPLVAEAGPGDVIVIDNAGHVDVSCWGGLLAEAATVRGIAGVIIDGACRDVQESEALGLPVHARAAVPVSARGRIVQEAMDVPVQVGGVTVEAGDWVVAGRNGLAFVPHSRLDDVLTAAEKIMEGERRMGEAVRAGRSVVEVMHDSHFTAARVNEMKPPPDRRFAANPGAPVGVIAPNRAARPIRDVVVGDLRKLRSKQLPKAQSLPSAHDRHAGSSPALS